MGCVCRRERREWGEGGGTYLRIAKGIKLRGGGGTFGGLGFENGHLLGNGRGRAGVVARDHAVCCVGVWWRWVGELWVEDESGGGHCMNGMGGWVGREESM